MFAYLVLLSAFLIEAIGTYVSVIGLSALFAQNPIITALAVALDIGKVVTVSFLYKYWKRIGLAMKTYMSIAAIVLMIVTSTGCFGYLSAQFQHAITSTNQDTVILQSMEAEQTKLQNREKEINTQIAKLPDNSVNGRTKLIKQFAPELDGIHARLSEIDKKIPELKVASIQKNQDVGPIMYVAKAFNTDAEHAVVWVIGTIIFVFDPLATALLIAGNFLLNNYRRFKAEDEIERVELEKEVTAHKVIKDRVNDEPKKSQADVLEELFQQARDKPVEKSEPEDLTGIFNDVVEECLPIEGYVDESTDADTDEQPILDTGAAKPPEHPTEALQHLSDADLHVLLGRVKPSEHPIEAIDHIEDEELHALLGRQKPTNDVVHEVDYEGREVHTKEQLLRANAPKSKLEEIQGASDIQVDDELPARAAKMSNLNSFYQIDAPSEASNLSNRML